MKDVQIWADEFCNKYVLNCRGNEMREWVESVQKDARAELLEQLDNRKQKGLNHD